MIPTPVAIGLTLCERVIIEEGTRNLTLVSTLDRFSAAAFPYTPSFWVVAGLTSSQGTGQVSVSVLHLDTDEELLSINWPTTFSDRFEEVLVVVPVANVTFVGPGVYEIMIQIDGEYVAHRRFTVFTLEEDS